MSLVLSPSTGPTGEPAGSHSGFRPDIEGLRGVAVLAVVLYHADLLSGGFVGVDVFFVLSGFLITGLLHEEWLRSGRVSLPAFYARRARRLLPAAVLVLVATAVASAVLLPPLRATEVLDDAKAASVYVVNERFADEQTDYLGGHAEASPFQHYWSLAVEEQFYLIWPLLLLGALGLAERARVVPVNRRPFAVAAALVTIGAASFALGLRWSEIEPASGFFSLLARAWEFVAGAVVALLIVHVRRMPSVLGAALAWTGLLAVATASIRLGATTPYPGSAALLPVLGTTALLAGTTAAHHRGVGVALTWRPLRWSGRVSYSWYLWHWPLLSLAPATLARPLTPLEKLAVVALSALIAAATHRAVEQPFRFASPLVGRARRSLAAGGALTAVALAVSVGAQARLPAAVGGGLAPVAALPDAITGAAAPTPAAAGPLGPPAPTLPPIEAAIQEALQRGAATAAVPANLRPSLARAQHDRAPPFVNGCNNSYRDATVRWCVSGTPGGRATVVLFGDSHAAQWFPGVEAAALERGWRVVTVTKATCPPALVELRSPALRRQFRECERWREQVFSRVAAERPEVVVLGAARHYNDEYRFSVYGPEWLAGLGDTVGRIRAAGANVVALGPTPKPQVQVPQCLSARLRDVPQCVTARSVAVNAAGVAAEREAVASAGGRYMEVDRWICTAETCPVVVDDLLVYRDDNHLSTSYPTWLAPALADAIAAAMPNDVQLE